MKSIDNKYENFKYYHFTNCINIPPQIFGSLDYNEDVNDVRINGVYEYHRDLFEAIEKPHNIEESSCIFEMYMKKLFDLSLKVNGKRNGSYLRVLRGWMFNSDSVEGAVLKGWVESRFGLVPFYHKKPISDIHAEAYYEFMVDKMNKNVNKNSMYYQLDLLYTYVQQTIRKYFKGYSPTKVFYRGVNNLEEHRILEHSGNIAHIQHNCLTSFTEEKHTAEQFGDTILSIDVPYTKIFFFSKALPGHSFTGEQESLILGGRYLTRILKL